MSYNAIAAAAVCQHCGHGDGTRHCPCCRTAAVDTGHTATMWPNPTPH